VKAQTASASANCQCYGYDRYKPFRSQKMTDLNFGKIIVAGTAGTVTVSHYGRQNIATGDVIFQCYTRDIKPLSFTVTGLADATYAITLPADLLHFKTGGNYDRNWISLQIRVEQER
jgi:hypothetical protein